MPKRKHYRPDQILFHFDTREMPLACKAEVFKRETPQGNLVLTITLRPQTEKDVKPVELGPLAICPKCGKLECECGRTIQ